MSTTFQIEHWGQKFNAKMLRPSSHLSGHAQIFPPSYRDHQDLSHRLRTSEAEKTQRKKQACLNSQPKFRFCFQSIIFRNSCVTKQGLSDAQFTLRLHPHRAIDSSCYFTRGVQRYKCCIYSCLQLYTNIIYIYIYTYKYINV